MQWFLSLGLSQGEIAKAVASFPKVLGCSLEKKLKPTAAWFQGLGPSKCQLAKIICSFPPIPSYSISKNLRFKLLLSQDAFGTFGAAEQITRQPRLLVYSCYERLSKRLQVLSEQNETMKLPQVMGMTDGQFHARFRKES